MRLRAAITGLGVTEMGKVYDRTPADFAGEAVASALDDAGLAKDDLDGLMVNWNAAPGMDHRLAFALGLQDLSLLNATSAVGTTAAAMVQYAALAIDAGLATTVALVYADAPLRRRESASVGYGRGRGPDAPGFESLRPYYGDVSANARYALAARRHMHRFGTTSQQLGAIAVAQRSWAQMNPRAQHREPMTLADHQGSRMVADPLHLLDCCVVSNGAVAVIVTSADRAVHLRQPPVHVWSAVQGVCGETHGTGREHGVDTGAAIAGPRALREAGVALGDVDVLELYDCYTYTVLVTLEDYGFCAKGEGGPFVADGRLAPGGSLPTNTGGGQLSSYYMWGFTPLAEGVTQARGQAGPRQVPAHDVVMVSGNGGVLDLHATMILSPHAA